MQPGAVPLFAKSGTKGKSQSAAREAPETQTSKIRTPPLKEKETEKETTGSVSGSRVRVRVGADTFFDPALDPVSVAVAVFGGNRDDRRLWRWYLYRIGEDAFRQLAFTQWRENRSDGMPNKQPACFQCKLTAANAKSCYLENIKITSADLHSSKDLSPEVPIEDPWPLNFRFSPETNTPSHNESNAPALAAQAHPSTQGRLSREKPYPARPCTSSPTWTKSNSLQSRQKAC